jgi:large subunit ribosomal protein L29
LRQFNDDDLKDKLTDLKVDLAKLRSEATKGTLKKEAGVIRWKRRDIARILTLMNERTGGKK